ncbi:MAG TPA: hypothetical protein VHI51_13900, partial [Ktedonobacterales bacterium]|nr:hypothetical protein [Ktedonobacterales bacterium]
MRRSSHKATRSLLLAFAAALAMLLAACQPGGYTCACGQPYYVEQILKESIGGIADIKTVDPAVNTDLYSAEVIELLWP